jgi:hypothetical protein
MRVDPDIPFCYTECSPEFDKRWVLFGPSANWSIYFDDIMFRGLAFADKKSCFDCRLSGGKTAPPGFAKSKGAIGLPGLCYF